MKRIPSWLEVSLGLFAGIIPFIWISCQLVRVQMGEWDLLGPEPGKAVVLYTGSWAFYFLIATLVASTARRLLSISWLLRRRRMLGLWCFFYATLHLLAYTAFLLEWDWRSIGAELIKRQYLTFGMLGWLLLLSLAVTSTKGWQRRLRQRWKILHKAVYIIAVLAALHYLLQIRANWLEPVFFSGVLLVLLGERFWHSRQQEHLS